ncbi:MAG: hypothetical protein SFU27_09540, partial [Thermonemataceae bacterium]|nr:hypothetical protein [Thermonemataceae bacterium]
FALFFSLVYGQQKQYIYCELVGTAKLFSFKVNVSVDYGQEIKAFRDNLSIRDGDGKIKSFNSMVDALNYMGSQGWEFVQAYTVTSKDQNVYHWLLKKEADINELEYLKNITTKKADNTLQLNEKPQAPAFAENASFTIEKKDGKVNINCTFNAQKRCTVKSKIKLWFDNEYITSVNNNTDKNCNGNFSFTLEGKALETAKQKGIKVLQVPSTEGTISLGIDTNAFLTEISK